MAQTWSYSAVLDIADWSDTKALKDFRKATGDEWETRADEAGYKLKAGTSLQETIVPLWRNSQGNYTDIPGEGEAVARKLVFTGVVTRPKTK